MIHKIEFKNFKALRDVEVPLERFTVIVGPNSSGKSSILEGLHYLTQASKGKPAELFKYQRHPLHLYSRGGSGALEISCQATAGVVRLQITPPVTFPEDVLHPRDSSSILSTWGFDVRGRPTDKGEGPLEQLIESPVLAQAIRSAVLLRLEASRLAAPSYSEFSPPRVQYDGEGLASVLAYLALNQPDEFQQLQAGIRVILPALRRIRFDRAPISRTEVESVTIGEESVQRRVRREYMGDALVFDMVGAPSLPAHLVSEGTILVLGMLTILMGPTRPKLVLLDDIDHGLHPKAQQEFVRMIRKLLEQQPDLQIVATTHSPYLLDCLEAKEVRLTVLADNGAAVCSPLQNHPHFPRWKEEMTPGEFWSTVGEKWVVAERAVGG